MPAEWERTTYFRQFTTASAYAADARETKHDTSFDGDGRPVMEYKRERPCSLAESPEECTGTWVPLVSHYLISSVTRQKITTLYDGGNGGQDVYMGQTKIAGYLSFTVSDPVTGSSAKMQSDGTTHLGSRTELAGLGMSVPLTAPQSFPPIMPQFDHGYVGDAEFGCVLDGILQRSCNYAFGLARAGVVSILGSDIGNFGIIRIPGRPAPLAV